MLVRLALTLTPQLSPSRGTATAARIQHHRHIADRRHRRRLVHPRHQQPARDLVAKTVAVTGVTVSTSAQLKLLRSSTQLTWQLSLHRQAVTASAVQFHSDVACGPHL